MILVFLYDLDSLPTAWDLVEWPIYSYLAGQMKSAMRDGKEMPEEVKALLKAVKGAAGGYKDPHPAVAPISVCLWHGVSLRYYVAH